MKMKIDDIAKLANVSRSAVSIALNGKTGISEETRSKILRIVHESGYIPRSMIKIDQVYPMSKTVRFAACTNSGIVTDQYENLPFFAELIFHIDEQCRSHGFSMVFSSIPSDQFDEKIEKIEQESPARGMILLGTNLTEDQIERISLYQPNLVVIDTAFEKLNINFVVMNNFMGAYQAGKYLVELGHQEIGYVQSSVRMFNFEERKRGFLSSLNKNGIEMSEHNVFQLPPTVVVAQNDFKQALLTRKGPLPTALFCECDYMAISVIKSLHELGYRVPDDVSVMGFDNISEANIVTPELTTIHVEKERMAKLAVASLIELIEDKDSITSKSVVDTRLVERRSCKSISAPVN